MTTAVVAKNQIGVARSEATLVIKEKTFDLPDRIMKPLEAKLTPVGSPTQLRVEFTKRDTTQIKWFHVSINVTTHSWAQIH